MPDIVLATLNAKFPHAAFGLRYLMANLGPLAARAAILEFDINQRPIDILESILAQNPRIVGLGIYIWNAAQSTPLAADLKRLRPEIKLILGGPEISHETEEQEIARHADHIITGEADLAFAQVCAAILAGRETPRLIHAPLPQFEIKGSGGRVQGSGVGVQGSEVGVGSGLRVQGSEVGVQGSDSGQSAPISQHSSLSTQHSELSTPSTLSTQNSELPHHSALRTQHSDLSHHSPPPAPLVLPYHLYDDKDLAHRVVYVEASRGCPFKCEFCLSSLDVPLRNVPLDAFLSAMQSLLDRGLRRFKFVDRTFNLNLNVSRSILQFFLDRLGPGLFLHFEMIPDRLPEGLRELIRRFPPGTLQFEVGIQTFNEKVAELISRRQDNARLEENLRFLRAETGVHVHADLIVGLPGEDMGSFAAGFDRLVRLGPQEIQVGMLKRLRGTPIVRHDAQWGMVYSPHAPYEVLQTRLIDFATMRRLARFGRYWDLLSNSGNFRATLPMLWTAPDGQARSCFRSFMELSDKLYERMGRNHGIALQDLGEFLFRHLIERGHLAQTAAERLWQDYQALGRSDRPQYLRPHIVETKTARPGGSRASTAKRQARHLA